MNAIAILPNVQNVTLADVVNDAAIIGQTEGETSNMKHELMLKLARHAFHGVISVDKTSSDVEQIASAYFKGKKGATYAPGTKDFNEGTFKKSVSQFKSIARCGAHPSNFGVEVLEQAVDIAGDFRRREKSFGKSIFQSLVDVAVVQNKTERQLTPEEIAKAIFPEKPAPEYDLAKRIDDALKTIRNLIDGTADKDGNPIKPAARTIDVITAQRLESIIPGLELALASAADKPNHQPVR